LNEIYSGEKLKDGEKVIKFSESVRNLDFFNKNTNIDFLSESFKNTKYSEREYVEDMLTKKDLYRKTLNFNSQTENNLTLYLKVIYQIRCNFFHGDKMPSDPDDEKLIIWAYETFHDFWR